MNHSDVQPTYRPQDSIVSYRLTGRMIEVDRHDILEERYDYASINTISLSRYHPNSVHWSFVEPDKKVPCYVLRIHTSKGVLKISGEDVAFGTIGAEHNFIGFVETLHRDLLPYQRDIRFVLRHIPNRSVLMLVGVAFVLSTMFSSKTPFGQSLTFAVVVLGFFLGYWIPAQTPYSPEQTPWLSHETSFFD